MKHPMFTADTPALSMVKLRALVAETENFGADDPLWMVSGLALTWGDLRQIAGQDDDGGGDAGGDVSGVRDVES